MSDRARLSVIRELPRLANGIYAVLVVIALLGCQRTPAPSELTTPSVDTVPEESQGEKLQQSLLKPQVATTVEPVDWAASSNLFANASFEEGREPWTSLAAPERPHWMDFEISDQVAKSGLHAALLALHATGTIHRGARIWGLVRDFEKQPLPQIVSGWYRVENWKRGSKRQYVQVVVMAFGVAEEFPDLKGAPVQLAYVLAGIDEAPFNIRNRKFLKAGPIEPQRDVWIPFRFDLHRDFESHWGRVPKKSERVRVMFEARFDDPAPAPDLAANVYFDDLYFGPDTE